MGAHPSRALRAALSRRRDRRILVLGLDQCGKSVLCAAITARVSLPKHVNRGAAESPADPLSSSRGATVDSAPFQITSLPLGSKRLELWDVRGSEDARKLWAHCYVGTSAVLFVVDCSDATRLPEAQAELRDISLAPELAGVPVLIVISKCDVVDNPGDSEGDADRATGVATTLKATTAQCGRDCEVAAVAVPPGGANPRGIGAVVEWIDKNTRSLP